MWIFTLNNGINLGTKVNLDLVFVFCWYAELTDFFYVYVKLSILFIQRKKGIGGHSRG